VIYKWEQNPSDNRYDQQGGDYVFPLNPIAVHIVRNVRDRTELAASEEGNHHAHTQIHTVRYELVNGEDKITNGATRNRPEISSFYQVRCARIFTVIMRFSAWLEKGFSTLAQTTRAAKR